MKYLKKKGIRIGEDLRLYDAPSIVIDESRPWLLQIGNHVRLTHGVIILTHDFSKSVLLTRYAENIGEGATTTIGNNCFIGNNSIILMGAKIGNNVIVGAGSVVHGLIPDNVVVAGNPARVICSLDEYYEKRKRKSPYEAINVATEYHKAYGRMPSEYEMRHFKSSFSGRNGEYKSWENFEEFISEVNSKVEGE
ncbi:MAG: acyltransferase [Clostridiales bacterium]|nr:acyltransferase [Clostridiales bacterium]